MQDLLKSDEDVFLLIEERENINLVQTGEGIYTYMTDSQKKGWDDFWKRQSDILEDQLKNRKD